MNITEDYVSFTTAKLLKEKGFDCSCEYQYINCSSGHPFLTDIRDDAGCYYKNSEIGEDEYSAPTLQMAMKWLRMEKDIQIEITIVGMEWESPTKWYYGFRCQNKEYIDRRDANFTSYEKACEAAIKYCLENLI